jgi:oligopeptide/dipeptide ABC transporter ATP-binding protein
MSAAPLLSVRGLITTFPTASGAAAVVDGVDLDVAPGEVLGIVGESGSGKSVTALSIMRLIAWPGRIAGGTVLFEGQDLLARSEAEMQRIRGAAISMIFQEPMASLNPIFSVGDQITETLRHHQGLSRPTARARALDLLKLVEIASADRRIDEYPHQMSGGMRQRVMIAIALACRPRLLIADEPTTALDVTIQAQILDLLRGLQREMGMAVILITHDLGLIAEFAQRTLVMYAGRVVEEASVRAAFKTPRHPYTEGLLASIPPLTGLRGRLNAIDGTVPAPNAMPAGCRFNPRCTHAMDACRAVDPPLLPMAPGQRAACIRHTGYRLDGTLPGASA